jgi:ubiquinone/menaquinone biosynthesis C-methylase UbiE
VVKHKNNKKKSNSKAKKYSSFYETPFGKIILDKELEILNRELQDCKKVLSVGCGPAVHEVQLMKLHPELNIICLDPSKNMLAEGRELSTRMNLLRGTAEQLPFRNEIFDSVYFITSFEFIGDSITALKETSRVLKPYEKAQFLISNFKSWYFQKEHTEIGSYIELKIKHLDNAALEDAISSQFQIESITLNLGIRGEEVFDTNDPKWASLYVISAIKRSEEG